MRIDATYRVVTPLFCAGAVPDHAELRLPSFKGALRFWWRALAWPRCGGDLQAIRQEEDALFGSAGGGQSRVSIRSSVEPNSLKTAFGEALKVEQGSRYLGYGVLERGVHKRACLRAPFEFAVQLRGRDLGESQRTSLKDALIALGILAGMGSRSRNGYGSLNLKTLDVDGTRQWNTPGSMEELQESIEKTRHDGGISTLPEYTAVSPCARHILLSSRNTKPMALLNFIGLEMLEFRKFMRGDRIAFGLPRRNVRPVCFDRRASPLFIHIHECGDSPVAVLSFLPARFLPEGRSHISGGGRRVAQRPEEELYRPIHDFLDRLLDPAGRGESFTHAIEVGP